MLKFFFLLFFLTQYFLSISQVPISTPSIPENTRFKNEIGINLYSLVYTYISERVVQSSWANGLVYKRHIGKYTFRLGFNQNQYEFDSDPTGSDGFPFYRHKTQRKSNEIFTGFQKSLGNRKVKPFFGIDWITFFGTNKGVEEMVNCFVPPYFDRYEYDYSFIKNGLAPLIGIEYSPINRISIALEANVFFYYTMKLRGTSFGSIEEFYFEENPVKMLSVNYRF